MDKKHRPALYMISTATALAWWIARENKRIGCTSYLFTSPRLPTAFSGFKVAHISDLHNAVFGSDNRMLLRQLALARPDLIAVTGDFIDSRRTKPEVALAFAEQALRLAPICYVAGNHESRIPEFEKFSQALKELGVSVLLNQTHYLHRDGAKIAVGGLNDPAFDHGDLPNRPIRMAKRLQALLPEEGEFFLLLSHRPEQFYLYACAGVDLTLCGHAHGGQVRLPGMGGLIAPVQGWFPKYDAGFFQRGISTMVVSRGLGNSLFPFRVNNPPELVLITLQTGDTDIQEEK